jgi:hypothetical protein
LIDTLDFCIERVGDEEVWGFGGVWVDRVAMDGVS